MNQICKTTEPIIHMNVGSLIPGTYIHTLFALTVLPPKHKLVIEKLGSSKLLNYYIISTYFRNVSNIIVGAQARTRKWYLTFKAVPYNIILFTLISLFLLKNYNFKF